MPMQPQRYRPRRLFSWRTSHPTFTANAPTGNNAAQRYDRNGFSRKVMNPDSSRLKEMFNTPKVIRQTIPSHKSHEHSNVPAVPGQIRLTILFTINGNRQEMRPVA